MSNRRRSKKISMRTHVDRLYRQSMREERLKRSGAIKLAGATAAAKAVLTKDQRNHLIAKLADTLRTFRSTPFEFEGACRQGVRSGLCLSGVPWARGDIEAERLVGAALNQIGAKRPTWEEGQPNYTIAPENCSWCHGSVPEDAIRGEHSHNYCSEVCARSALEHRAFSERSNRDAAYRSIQDAIIRARHPVRECAHCAKRFRPTQGDGRYCSPACQHEAMAIDRRQWPDRTCECCQKTFRPTSHGEQRYCSRECAYAHRSFAEVRQCEFCGDAFTAHGKKAKYCGEDCSHAASRDRRGLVPVRLNRLTFDHYIALSLHQQRPAWLTPERFDEMVAG
jgi:hypothetical protein